MKILIVNAGSSSLKYQLIDMDNEQTLAKGLVERIGMAENGKVNGELWNMLVLLADKQKFNI